MQLWIEIIETWALEEFTGAEDQSGNGCGCQGSGRETKISVKVWRLKSDVFFLTKQYASKMD